MPVPVSLTALLTNPAVPLEVTFTLPMRLPKALGLENIGKMSD